MGQITKAECVRLTVCDSEVMRGEPVVTVVLVVIAAVVVDGWSTLVCSVLPVRTFLPVLGSIISSACFGLRCCCCSDDEDAE